MEENSNFNTEEPSDKDSQPFDAIRLTVKTLFWVFIVGVLLFGSFLSFFPYSAMRLYSKYNNKNLAENYAEVFLERSGAVNSDGNSKYADALFCALNNSVYLMNNEYNSNGGDLKKSQKYAEKTLKYGNEYLRLNSINSYKTRTAIIDSFNRKNSIPQMHSSVSLYSYNDYIQSNIYRAQLILGKSDELKAEHLQYISANFATLSYNHSDYMFFLNLNKYLSFIPREKPTDYSFFIENSGKPTEIFIAADKIFPLLIENIKQNQASLTAEQHLKYTFYLAILSEFNQNMKNISTYVAANKHKFLPENITLLKALLDNAEKNFKVQQVNVFKGGKWQTIDTNLNEWYVLGMRQKYIDLYYSAN